MKKEKGITLIALAITIVVLLILAGVTIVGITGENGIIRNAKEAKVQSEIGAEKEIIDVSVVQAIGDNERGNLEKIEYENRLKKNSKKEPTNVFEDGEFLITEFVNKNRFYQVDKDGNVEGPIEKIEDEFAGDITKGGSCDGSEEKPYEINCIEDLVVFSIMSNGGNTSLGITADNFNNKYIVLNKTLDFNSIFSYNNSKLTKYGDLNTNGIVEDIKTELTNKTEGCVGFTPIKNFYNGTFDGKNNEIKNIYQNEKNDGIKKELAPFLVAKTIKNLSISGDIINNEWHAAGICSGGKINIINCKNYSNVTGYNMVGGILAFGGEGGNIQKCANFGNIKIVGNAYQYTGCGGIVGTINVGTNKYINIEECLNEGDVTTLKNIGNLGGITGCVSNRGSVNLNKNINYGRSKGGIIGKEQQGGETIVTNCANYGECENGIVNDYSGADWNSILKLDIKNCYNLGKVSNSGIIGSQGITCKEINLNIENCYNAGMSNKPIIGKILTNSSTNTTTNIKNTYYDKSKSTLPGEYTIGITAMNETEMKNNQTFIDILNNNIGANAEWRRWKVGENGYPTFE